MEALCCHYANRGSLQMKLYSDICFLCVHRASDLLVLKYYTPLQKF